MAKMRLAISTMHLGPGHPQFAVDGRADGRIVGRLEKAGPTCATVELSPGGKERGVAADAAKCARGFGKVVVAKGPFRRVFARDAIGDI